MLTTGGAFRASLGLVVALLLTSTAFAQQALLADQRGTVVLREPLISATRGSAPVVVAIPGSGCERLDRSITRLFAGLPSARVLLLQKPLLAEELGAPCPVAFVRADRLSRWLAQASELALEAVQKVLVRPESPKQSEAPAKWLLVGLSEGAELLPGVASALQPAIGPASAWLMVGHPGLDPAEAGELQAQRVGALKRWKALMMNAAKAPQATDEENGPTKNLTEGRTLAYWADLRLWPLQEGLLTANVPLVRAHGGADELIPEEAYSRFSQRAADRLCSVRFDALDHELRGITSEGALVDGLQVVWKWVEEGWLEADGFGMHRCKRLHELVAGHMLGKNFRRRQTP